MSGPLRALPRSHPDYGKGSYTIAADELPVDPEELTRTLIALFDAPSYKAPLLPGAAQEILLLSQKPDVPIAQLGKLLETDSLLASRVLRAASSPLHSPSGAPIRSIKEAVARLGLRGLRDLVLEAALDMKIFRAPTYAKDMERVQKHCTQMAHASRRVCRYTTVDGEYAYLCGLLHDIGVAGILIALGENKQVVDREVLMPAIKGAHERCGEILCRIWKLPEEIQLVVGHHHELSMGRMVHPLDAVLVVSERCLEKRVSGELYDRHTDERFRRATEVLGLGEPQLKLIEKELATLPLE